MIRLCLLFLLLNGFFYYPIRAQNLPGSWSITPDGRMLMAGGENEGGFYDPATVQDVQLEFAQDNWWTLMENNYASGTDILATCWINGIQYDSVGVRFKGETSYRRNNTEKKSFNITLDYIIDGQDVDGYNTFNLNCGWEDNSSIKEVLYNNVGHNYYMSLKANYVNLTLNGENWGPYQSVQQFDSDYIREWYLSNDGTIWRAESMQPRGGGPGGPRFGAGRSTLNYNGPDSSDYNLDYTLKRTELVDPWAGMIAACDVLNNEPLATLESALNEVLDIDKACWFLAHEIVWGDDDSYINKGGSDYYVYYEAETGRIIPMEYDGNSVLGTQGVNWGLFYNESNTDFPLLNRMLAVPAIRQRYLAHVRVILEDYFTADYTNSKIDAWAALIDEFVQEDPKKFYTTAQFQTAVANLKQSIVTRRNLLLADSELSGGTSLNISDVAYSTAGVRWQAPTVEEDLLVVATVSDAPASVWLYYGAGITGAFAKTEMFDDGQHNDAAANDGQYGGTIPPLTSGAYGRFYLEAIANDGAGTVSYEPKGAEHNVFLYQVDNTSAITGDLVINEFMASNDTTVADADGEFDDWIELYNNTSENISLEGFALTDDASELGKWTFPAGASIDGNDYLIIWADEDLEQSGLHADFKLSAGGESLLLVDATGAIVDSLTYPEQETDISHGRFPNGTGDFQDMDPTFNAENTEGITDTSTTELMPSPLAGDLVVNEFMASNDTTIADADGEFEDWIELYNNTNQSISLDGFFLSDDLDETGKWAFPVGTTIAANDYLIIWADEDLDQSGLHADFKLSAGGETLVFTDENGDLIDTITYADQVADISHGRFPNGTGDFRDMTPTFNAENNDGIVSTRSPTLVGADLTLFPNPTAGILNIRLEAVYQSDLSFRLLTTEGRVLQTQILHRGNIALSIDASSLPAGFYLLAVTDGQGSAMHKVMVK